MLNNLTVRSNRNFKITMGVEILILGHLEHDLGNQPMLVWKAWCDLGKIFPRATIYNVNLS